MRLRLGSSGGITGMRERIEGELETSSYPAIESALTELMKRDELSSRLSGLPKYPDAQCVVIELPETNERFVVDESTASGLVLHFIDAIRTAIDESMERKQ